MKIKILFDCRSFFFFWCASSPPTTLDISLCILEESLFLKGSAKSFNFYTYLSELQTTYHFILLGGPLRPLYNRQLLLLNAISFLHTLFS